MDEEKNKQLTLDETALLCRAAAGEAGFPQQLAEFAGEMVVWLERHRMPGIGAMAIALDTIGRFDAGTAGPELLESGEFRFPEAFTGGMFILGNFPKMKFPAKINGPNHGALLMVPFFALAAQQNKSAIRIAFLDEDDKPAAQVSYEDGQSRIDGDMRAVLVCRKLGIEYPVKLDCELRSPFDGPVTCPAEIADRLAPKH